MFRSRFVYGSKDGSVSNVTSLFGSTLLFFSCPMIVSYLIPLIWFGIHQSVPRTWLIVNSVLDLLQLIVNRNLLLHLNPPQRHLGSGLHFSSRNKTRVGLYCDLGCKKGPSGGLETGILRIVEGSSSSPGGPPLRLNLE